MVVSLSLRRIRLRIIIKIRNRMSRMNNMCDKQDEQDGQDQQDEQAK